MSPLQGSRSKINELVGLNNRNDTLGYAVIQNRGPVSPEIEAKLPKTFKEEGALLWLADDLPGFASIYPSDPADNPDGKSHLQLFCECSNIRIMTLELIHVLQGR